jgi:hypothetical protein
MFCSHVSVVAVAVSVSGPEAWHSVFRNSKFDIDDDFVDKPYKIHWEHIILFLKKTFSISKYTKIHLYYFHIHIIPMIPLNKKPIWHQE